MKQISVIAAFLIVVASATLVMAGPHGRGSRGNGGWCPEPSVLASLNLTSEQSEKIMALHQSGLEEFTPIRAELLSKKGELRLLWMQTKLDPEKIRSTQREIRALIGQIQDKSTDLRLAFRNILTPEQTTKLLAEGIGKGKGHRWGNRHSRRGPGGGPGSHRQN